MSALDVDGEFSTAFGEQLPLDLCGEEFRSLVEALLPRLTHALDTLDEGPAAAYDTALGEA